MSNAGCLPVRVTNGTLTNNGSYFSLDISAASGMTSFDLSGDSGTDQTITNGNVLEIVGGVGITTATSATDTITLTWAPAEQVNSVTLFDGSQASRTETINLSGTDPVWTYSSAAAALTGSLSATNLSGTNTGDNTVATSGDSATAFFSSGALELAIGGTNQTSWTGSRCVQVNAGGTALESAAAACGSGGAGDQITVNTTAIDTTANLKDTATVTWAVVDGGAGGPDDAQATAVDVTCTDCLGTTEIADSYVLNAGDAMTGQLNMSDGAGDSPDLDFTPQTGTVFGLYVEDTGDDLQIQANTASTETVDIVNIGAGVTDLTIDGDLTISGDDLFLATNTDRFVLMGDGTNYNPEAIDLGTDTAGNYVASATASQGLLVTGTEGASVGLDDCAANQIWKRNAGDTAWACAADADSGGATAWDSIGDAVADGTVAFAGTTQTITGNTNDVTAIAQDLLHLSYTNDAVTDILVQRGLVIENLASTNGMETALDIINSDTDDVITTGINFNIAAGLMTTAIDATDPQIGTALSVAANDILGTTGLINYDSFDVDASGNIVSAGDITVSGGDLLTGDIALRLGDATTDTITLTTDGTGDGEVVLPLASVSAAETALTAGVGLTLSTNDLQSDGFIIGGSTTITMTATMYCAMLGGRCNTNSAAANRNVSPMSGTIKNCYFSVHTAPGAGQSWTTAVVVASSATAQTCSIADTNTACSDVTHTADVTAGQTWGVSYTEVGAAADAVGPYYSCQFVPN